MSSPAPAPIPQRSSRSTAKATRVALNRGRRSSVWGRFRRAVTRTEASRTEQTMLPVLIQVFAGFTKLDGKVDHAEIDSILGFLRYDYPETVYSELRELYSNALSEAQNLDTIGRDLADRLPLEEKILLGVQLYVLISRADLPKEHLITFYQFMTTLGVASEAINIVYQLNTSEQPEEPITDDGDEENDQPLETIIIGREKPADVVFENIVEGESVATFRFQDLILLKNNGSAPVIVRGRQIGEGEFCRVYEGQRMLIAENVLDYQDLLFYFNAKKNVSSTQLFLGHDESAKEHFIEKSRTKHSYARVDFGLDIAVDVLRSVDAVIKNAPLKRGTKVDVTLKDKIVFADHSEINFSDLRRRARELGGRFQLLPSRSEYLVSNNPNLLNEGDILLSPGIAGEVLLRIKCNFAEKSGELEIIESKKTILVGERQIRQSSALVDDDVISIGDGHFLRCHFSEGLIEEERNFINVLNLRDVSHSYDRKVTALDNISFSLQRGEMVCVMGPSGCGKSTLLKTLAGQQQPDRGRVDLNGFDLYENHTNLSPFIAYIPQDEAFDSLLTVEENIDTAAAMRSPHFTRAERRRRADSRMVELGLSEIRHRLAGDAQTKNLSGGQRKRLNVGMDMIGIADVYLFDEPTSGLSSKDSEHVLEIIRGLTHNKITLVSIHQPSSRLFHMFDKAILLDNGGNLAFFGTPYQMLHYFGEAKEQEGVSTKTVVAVQGIDECDNAVALTPDFVFDVLETPLRDLSGDVIYEQDARGQLAPARRFNPQFWRDRFQTFRLLQEVNLREIATDSSGTIQQMNKVPQRPVRTYKDDWVQFCNQFKRAFLAKLRNRANLATTLLAAPLLAVLSAWVLRYSEGEYTYANAFHVPTYLFITLVIALFLGLTNSAEEIIRDRVLIERERNHGLRVWIYVATKVISLGIFAFAQCVIYLLLADWILEIRDMFWHNLFWMFATAMVGVSAGLVVSAWVNSPKTALNVIPLVVIPNIILGGALIKYEEMNSNLDIVDSVASWLVPEDPLLAEESDLKVPGICAFMPLRWSYEAIVIAHAKENPVARLMDTIEDEMQFYATKEKLTDREANRLANAKDALPITIAMEAEDPAGIRNQLQLLRDALITGEPLDYDQFEVPAGVDKTITAEDLYLNGKIRDLFNRAEVERLDYRRKVQPNVFFGEQTKIPFVTKKILKENPDTGEPEEIEEPYVIDTLELNAIVLILFASIAIVILHLTLRSQLRRV